MRHRIATLLVLVALHLVLLAPGQGAVAQSVAPEATPGSTAAEQPTPRFALLPVGDHPDGFFEDIEVAPGSSIELAVVVDNGGSIPLSLRTYKVNALSAVNGGYVSDSEESPPQGATAWIDYPPVEVALDPGTQHEISFTVSVPEDAAPGQYISGLVVETAEPLPIPGTESLNQVIGYAISVGILVPGDIEHSFELGAPEVIDEETVRFLTVPISNTGNYLIRPSGELTLTNAAGEEIVKTPIDLGSIYSGLSTTVEILLPEQMPPGDYLLDLSLTDPESGAADAIAGAAVTVPEPVDPSGVFVGSVAIKPNADPIVFANVALTLVNGGSQIPATNVVLEVMRDGEQVDSFPLATNQVLLSGENQLSARYIPATAWEPGTYTFRVAVMAVDPQGGAETILLTEDIEATIEVP